MVYPTTTPLPDEEPPKPNYGRYDNQDGGDTVPDHGLVGEYAENVRHQAEHNGASYHLKHMRSAPQQEIGFTSNQGRLLPHRAVPYTDERVGPVPQAFTQTPNGEALQYADRPGYTSDDYALRMRANPGNHPVFFPRPGGGEPAATNGPHRPDPEGATNAQGRTIWGGVHRTDKRY